MEAGQALLAAIPPGLAVYFEFFSPIPERKIQKQAAEIADLFGEKASSDAISEWLTAFATGTLSVYSFRPTVVAVAATSLSLIYELPEHNAFAGAAALVVALLIILPAFTRLESFPVVDIATFRVFFSGRLSSTTLRELISWSIVGLNVALIGLCYITYILTHK